MYCNYGAFFFFTGTVYTVYRLRIIRKLLRQLYKKLGRVEPTDNPQRGALSRDKQLVGDDGDRGDCVQLLEELEAVGILELEVDPMADEFEEGMEDTPGLALEHSWDQLGWRQQRKEHILSTHARTHTHVCMHA